ncbi:MAG: hypothetical protein ACR2PS_00160, partial [Pseudomonadales bacterium]
LPSLEFNADNLVSTPSLVVVGANDTNRDESVRRNPRVDRTQGHNRLARAEWFHTRLVHLARKNGTPVPHRFHVLPNTAHDFGDAVLHGGLADIVPQFCEQRRASRFPGEVAA